MQTTLALEFGAHAERYTVWEVQLHEEKSVYMLIKDLLNSGRPYLVIYE